MMQLSSTGLNNYYWVIIWKQGSGGNFYQSPVFLDFFSLYKPFLCGGVGAIGERRLGTLARHTLVCDLALEMCFQSFLHCCDLTCNGKSRHKLWLHGTCFFCNNTVTIRVSHNIKTLFLFFRDINFLGFAEGNFAKRSSRSVTFCRVFSPKLATRKIPLFRNGGESGSIFSPCSNLQTNCHIQVIVRSKMQQV